MKIFENVYVDVTSLVLQIPFEKVFRHPKPTSKPLAKGIGA